MTRSKRSGSAAAWHKAAIPRAGTRRHRRDSSVSRTEQPGRAHDVLHAIYASIHLIAEHPLSYQRTDDSDIRMHVVRRYRYKIFYSLTGATVEIIHVRHTSRRSWGGEQA